MRIALLGRPNVGKSTLFNRLTGRRIAVTSPVKGTTRDRLHGTTSWQGIPLTLIDTGGRDFLATGPIDPLVQQHIRRAIEEADLCLLICDGPAGLLPADQLLLDEVRKTGKPVLLAVNKQDDRLTVPPEFFALGVDPVIPVSALHGRGTGELLDALIARAKAPDNGAAHLLDREAEWAVAIVGRQNVGKSSLFNRLLEDERVIVSEVPGTTRDAVDTVGRFQGRPVRLVDTAGWRHRRKVRQAVDLFSMMRTKETLARCDVALMVLDATLGVANDDRRIINLICEAGCGLVLAANKWDLLKQPSERTLETSLRRLLPSVTFAPIVAVSAKTGWHVQECLAAASRVVTTLRRGVPEALCASILKSAWERHLPPRYLGRAIRLTRAQWMPGKPSRLILTTAPLGRLPQPYQHYLLKRLHAHPRFVGVPIQLVLQGPTR